MEVILAGILHGPAASALYREYLMVKHDQKLESPAFAKKFLEFTKKHIHQEINISTWRHIAAAIKREYIPQYFYKHFNGGSDIGDLQGGHSSNTANRLYAVSKNELANLNTQFLYYSCNFCRKWQDTLGVGRGIPPLPLILCSPNEHVTTTFTTHSPMTDRPQRAQQLANASSSSGSPSVTREVIQEMFAKYRQELLVDRAEHLHAAQCEIRAAVNEGIVQGFKVLSDKGWPCLNTCAPANTTTSSSEPFTSSFDANNTSVDFLDEQYESDASAMLQHMRTTYKNPTMKWKSEGQKKLLVVKTSKHDQNIVGCIPTGGGKSVTFEVTASTVDKKKTTLIVVPFRALLNQIFNNFKALKILCEEWSSPSCSMAIPPTVILVIADKCNHASFEA